MGNVTNDHHLQDAGAIIGTGVDKMMKEAR
jgi:hypothetical protein